MEFSLFWMDFSSCFVLQDGGTIACSGSMEQNRIIFKVTPSRGLGPFGFHMYRVTQSVGQVGALPSGVPSQGLLQEIQNWKPIIKAKGEMPRGRNLGALNYP